MSTGKEPGKPMAAPYVKLDISLCRKMADCPFCGATAEEFATGITYSTTPDGELSSYMGECAGCGAMGPPSDTEVGAFELWNTRPSTPVSGDASPLPLSGEQSYDTGADHVPGSRSREDGEALVHSPEMEAIMHRALFDSTKHQYDIKDKI